jgi:hypothetical protein
MVVDYITQITQYGRLYLPERLPQTNLHQSWFSERIRRSVANGVHKSWLGVGSLTANGANEHCDRKKSPVLFQQMTLNIDCQKVFVWN